MASPTKSNDGRKRMTVQVRYRVTLEIAAIVVAHEYLSQRITRPVFGDGINEKLVSKAEWLEGVERVTSKKALTELIRFTMQREGSERIHYLDEQHEDEAWKLAFQAARADVLRLYPEWE